MYPVITPEHPALKQLDEVDEVITRSVSAGDPLIACQFGIDLKTVMEIKGLVLAKLLHLMKDNWHLYQAAGTDDEFENFAQSQMSLTQQTVRKYTNMYATIFAADYVPEAIKDKLRFKPIKELLLLTSPIEEGVLTDDELETAVVADESKIKEMIREARGQDKNESRTAIYGALQVTDGKYPRGTLLVTRHGITETVGFLHLDTDVDFVNKFIARMKNSLNLQERDA